MLNQYLIINNKLGLHARASSKLVTLANTFKCNITLRKDNKFCSAKSLMSVMMLSANFGSQVILIADGEDEILAIAKISELINNKFGEEE